MAGAEPLACPRSRLERAGSPQGITLLCPCEGAKRHHVGAPCRRGWAASFPASHALQKSLPHPGSVMNPYQSAEHGSPLNHEAGICSHPCNHGTAPDANLGPRTGLTDKTSLLPPPAKGQKWGKTPEQGATDNKRAY